MKAESAACFFELELQAVGLGTPKTEMIYEFEGYPDGSREKFGCDCARSIGVEARPAIR